MPAHSRKAIISWAELHFMYILHVCMLTVKQCSASKPQRPPYIDKRPDLNPVHLHTLTCVPPRAVATRTWNGILFSLP